MPDVFTKAKRSEVMSRIRAGSELSEVEIVAADSEVFDDVCHDAARHIARMPGEGDEAIGTEGVRVMPVAARCAEQLAAKLTEAALQLAAVPGRILAHRSGGENEFVAKGGRDGAARFQQGFEMRLGGLLKPEDRLAAILSVRVAAGQQRGLGNPHVILVAAHLNFGNGNDHRGSRLSRHAAGVKSHA